MKHFFYTIGKFGKQQSVRVYQVKNNKPEFVAEKDFSPGSTRGTDSEAMQALVEAKLLPAKHSDTYYSQWANNRKFEIQQLY